MENIKTESDNFYRLGYRAGYDGKNPYTEVGPIPANMRQAFEIGFSNGYGDSLEGQPDSSIVIP